MLTRIWLQADDRSRLTKLWHVSNLYSGFLKASGWRTRLCDASFADVAFFCNSGCGSDGMRASRWRASFSMRLTAGPNATGIITFEGAFHGRTLATHRRRRPGRNISKVLARGLKDSIRFRSAILKLTKKAIGPETAAHHHRAAGRVKAACVRPTLQFFKRAACSCATSNKPAFWCSTKCRPAWAARASLFAYETDRCRRRTSWRWRKRLGGGFPDRRMPCHGRCCGKGMTPGTHGSTFGGNLLAVAAGERGARCDDWRRNSLRT
jgi:acetylornithine/N-succinyldiaminopimelate aminotransferase